MNICLYTPEQEENIFIQRRARTWQRSGLISENQFKIIEERTSSQLAETSLFFRILYFVFTWICLTAAVGLVIWLMDIDHEGPIGLTFLLFSIPFYMLAEYLVRCYHVFRHGIEEALALLSLGLFCGGMVLLVLSLPGHPDDHLMMFLTASLVCLFSFWLYIRFGFLYAALISIVALGFLPFQFSLPPIWERSLLFLLLGLLFLISLQTESDTLADFRKKRKGIIQACLFMGLYLTVNLRIFAVAESWFDQTSPHLIPYAGFPPIFYWVSYILTFLIPALGLYFGIQVRKRALINAAGVALVLSLATNKDYLGLKHYAWDPMIFGVTLILAAVLIIRWLAKGEDKARCGFTVESILKPERYGLTLPEIGAAVMPGVTMAATEAAPVEPSPFEDGQSGGGGASRNF